MSHSRTASLCYLERYCTALAQLPIGKASSKIRFYSALHLLISSLFKCNIENWWLSTEGVVMGIVMINGMMTRTCFLTMALHDLAWHLPFSMTWSVTTITAAHSALPSGIWRGNWAPDSRSFITLLARYVHLLFFCLLVMQLQMGLA